MNGVPIQSLRRLAIGAAQAARSYPLASAVSSRIVAGQTVQTVQTSSRSASTTASKSSRIPPSPNSRFTSSSSSDPKTPKVVPYKRYREPRHELTNFAEGHGEQIWIFEHIVTSQVIYSHTPVVKSNKALKQLPFNGKQTKPAKMRKDYWRPMALVQFEQGDGVVGRSVFQKLREMRRLHELSWGYQERELAGVGRKQRGQMLNNQRSNTIADVAAVLSGAGQGSRIWKTAASSGGNGEIVVGEGQHDLVKATLFWANDQDRNVADKWTTNVRHVAGIPSIAPSPRPAAIEEEAAPAPEA